MYKLLIIEDEDLIRNGLIAKVKSLNLPISEYFDASDVEHALEIFHRTSPDILITDIRLKKRDGLSLIQELKATNPNLQCIIVSGYPEFEYAKKAIELSVVGYALKPVGLDVLSELISRAICNIKSAQNISQALSELETQLSSLNVISELNSVIHSNDDQDNNVQKKLAKHFPTGGKYMLAAINVDRFSFESSLFTPLDIDIVIYSIRNIINDLSFAGTRVAFNNIMYNNQQLILFILPNLTDVEEKAIKTYCQTLIEVIGNVFQFHAICAISDPYSSITRMMYHQTQARLEGRILGTKPDNLLLTSDTNSSYSPLENELNLLTNYIESSDMSKLDVTLGKLLPQGASVEYYASALQDIAQVVKNVSLDCVKKRECATGIHDFSTNIGWFFSNSREICQSVADLIEDMLPAASADTIKSSYKINLAVKYIQANYKNPITVNSLAELYDINPNYFSTLFKKATTQTVLNYLTEVRLESAKYLLKTTDISNSEIAEMVGYDNVQYFYKVFKKATSLTPTAYKAQH